eukprot:2114158-Lingulodinium_polyedra.AAC.1
MPLLGCGIAPRVPESRTEADPLCGHQGPGLLADCQLVLQHLPPGRSRDRLSVGPPRHQIPDVVAEEVAQIGLEELRRQVLQILAMAMAKRDHDEPRAEK